MSKLNGKIGIKKSQSNQRIVHEAPLDQIAEQNDDIIDILDDELLLSDSFQKLAILSSLLNGTQDQNETGEHPTENDNANVKIRMKLENTLLRMTMLTSRR
jgi:hypothetical protein